MKIVASILLIVWSAVASLAQGLEKCAPVLLVDSLHRPEKGVSFILNMIEARNFTGQPVAKYSSGLQIVDADAPWPPRWFMVLDARNRDSLNAANHDSIKAIKDIVSDARCQYGYVSFYKEITTEYKSHKETKVAGYIVCNKNMQPIDTVKGVDLPVNNHDFRINGKGEKLITTKLDTLLNLSKMTGMPTDTAAKSTVDIIEILDAEGNLVFRWDPVKVLGVDALYQPYGGLMSLSAKVGFVDWSHANAVSWDVDGNIIYCFRHVGIGKISRKDGYVIWRIDRNNMPYANGDTLAFYLQHGLEAISGNADSSVYSIYNNGDVDHPGSYALVFSINNHTGAARVLQRKNPPKKLTSIRFGNYDVAADGSYLFNYGSYLTDTIESRTFLQYGKPGKPIVEYRFTDFTSAYKVHETDGWQPPRPLVKLHKKELQAAGDMTEWTWYRLSDRDNAKVQKVGEGATFIPIVAGKYCVAGKYGIGYSVSLPIDFLP